MINCVVVGDQLVMAPTFMGAEPCHVHVGPYAGTQVFTAEERSGLDLIRSLDDAQRGRAIVRPSIHPDDLPPETAIRDVDEILDAMPVVTPAQIELAGWIAQSSWCP